MVRPSGPVGDYPLGPVDIQALAQEWLVGAFPVAEEQLDDAVFADAVDGGHQAHGGSPAWDRNAQGDVAAQIPDDGLADHVVVQDEGSKADAQPQGVGQEGELEDKFGLPADFGLDADLDGIGNHPGLFWEIGICPARSELEEPLEAFFPGKNLDATEFFCQGIPGQAPGFPLGHVLEDGFDVAQVVVANAGGRLDFDE